MKETLIVISDYVEGEPVVASVRFAGLMSYFQERYELIVVNDEKYGRHASTYADTNYKYATVDSILTQTMHGNAGGARGHLGRMAENLLRHPWTLSAWRNYKYSKFKFDRMNAPLYGKLDALIAGREIAGVFVTVPDVYALYILDYIKRQSPCVQAVVEIRDIIDHGIGQGNPRYVYRQAEQMVSKLADGIIAVSRGIYQHYRMRNPQLPMRLITNGYDEHLFEDAARQRSERKADHLALVHIGSIYKGRNVGALVEGLGIYCRESGRSVTLHIAGLLDRQGLEDIDRTRPSGTGVEVRIHGSMEHEQAVQLLRTADAAVILTHPSGSDYAIPGKTFEYIGACKPILAVTEDGELTALVQGKYGECARHAGEDVARALARLMRGSYDFSDRSKYSRALQAEHILEFLQLITLDGGAPISKEG